MVKFSGHPFDPSRMPTIQFDAMPDTDERQLLHLTPRGWFRGDTPEERVLSVDVSGEHLDEVWRHEDDEWVRRTLSRFGAVPGK